MTLESSDRQDSYAAKFIFLCAGERVEELKKTCRLNRLTEILAQAHLIHRPLHSGNSRPSTRH